MQTVLLQIIRNPTQTQGINYLLKFYLKNVESETAELHFFFPFFEILASRSVWLFGEWDNTKKVRCAPEKKNPTFPRKWSSFSGPLFLPAEGLRAFFPPGSPSSVINSRDGFWALSGACIQHHMEQFSMHLKKIWWHCLCVSLNVDNI